MSDFDLLLNVGVNKDYAVKSLVNSFKAAQSQVEKESVTYTLKADEKNFLSQVKSLLASTPDLNKEIKIVLDDSSFKKGLDDVTRYAGKSAKSITSAYKKEFQSEFAKGDSLYLDNILGLSEGQNKSVSKVKKKIQEITDELRKYTDFTESKTGAIKINGIDMSKVSDYKDLERVVSLTKELDAILKQTGTKGDYKVELVDRKQLEDSVKSLQSGYSKAMTQYGDSYKSQLESMKAETSNTFSELSKILENVFVGAIDQILSKAQEGGIGIKSAIESSIEGIGESISSEVQEGAGASKKHLQDLETQLDSIKKKKQELSKGINTKGLYDDVVAAAEKVNAALEKGNAVNKEDAQAYVDAVQKYTANVASTKGNSQWEQIAKDYKSAAIDLKEALGDDFIPLKNMETRLDLLNKANAEEKELQEQITNEKRLIEEANQKREETVQTQEVQKETVEETNSQEVASEAKISIKEEEPLNSINKVKEALQELLESEINIELKASLVSNFIDDIQSQLNSIDPKPTIEVEAKIKPLEDSIDGLSVDQVKDLVNTVGNETSISLDDSISYVEKLKSEIKNIGDLNQFTTAFKSLPEDDSILAEIKRLDGEMDNIISKYPELSKFKTLFNSKNEAENFINSDEWDKFLATLPQAKTYLESIGHTFEETNQTELASANEIKSLEGLRDLIKDIADKVNAKSEAFRNEVTAVEESVSQEESILDRLKGKIDEVTNKLDETIEKLKNPENTEISFNPKPSSDFVSKIQEAIKGQTFEIEVVPKVSGNIISATDDKIDVQSVLDEMDAAVAKTQQLTQEEKEFNNAANKVTKDFINGANVSTKTIHNLREETKNILSSTQRNGLTNSSGLYDIMSQDAGYVTSMYGSSYSEIVKKIRGTKIKYSNADRLEFGDDWGDLSNILGRNLRKGEGIDPEVLLRELAEQYSEISTEGITNTQDALAYLRDYITETPKKYADIYKTAHEKYGAEEEALLNSKLAEVANETVIPTHLLGETQADSLEQLDDYNAKLQAKYDETEQILEEEQKAIEQIMQTEQASSGANYDSEANAARNDAEALKELAEANNLVDEERADDSVNTSIDESVNNIPQETDKLNELKSSAQGASEAKKKFAESNAEVLQSIISSLSALNSEGEGFKNLNTLINKLGNEDKVKPLVNNLKTLRDVLNEDINDNSFINAIKDIASQGADLKEVATVLKATEDEINKAKKATGKTTTSDITTAKKTAQSDIKSLSKRITKLGSQELTDELNQVKTSLMKVGDSADDIEKVAKAIADLTSKTSAAETESKNLGADAKTLINNYKDIATYYNQLKSAKEGSNTAASLQTTIDQLKAENEQLEKNNYTTEQSEKIKRAKASAELAETKALESISEAQKKATEQEEKATAAEKRRQESLEKSRADLLAQISALKQNGKMYSAYGDEIDEMYAKVSDTSSSESAINRVRTRLSELKAEANQTGNTGKSFWQQLTTKFTSLATYLSSFASFYKIVEIIRKAYTNVSELNAQMIELAKVSEQTINQIKGDFSEYADVAKDIGATISDTISATSDWARLGYSVPDAKQLAEVALLYKNVGDGPGVLRKGGAARSSMWEAPLCPRLRPGHSASSRHLYPGLGV